MLLFECSNGTIRSPERGSVGRHAVYDEAMLETPRIDEAFQAQYDEDSEFDKGAFRDMVGDEIDRLKKQAGV